jgi:hypothetical protein
MSKKLFKKLIDFKRKEFKQLFGNRRFFLESEKAKMEEEKERKANKKAKNLEKENPTKFKSKKVRNKK